MTGDLRWRQRFQNFQKAFSVFERRMNEYQIHLSYEAYQMALVQAFEIIIELSWKTLKDYLENQGCGELQHGKKVIRLAFQNQLISDAALWIAALEVRNETSHVYNDAVLISVLDFITDRFYPILCQLHQRLKTL